MAEEETKETEEQKEQAAPEDVREETEETKDETSQPEAEAEKSEEKTDEKPEEAKKEDEELLAKFMRLNADFQNYRRRTEAEKADIYSYANEKILTSLLDIVDNFERALASAPENDKFADGMKMVFKQLQDILQKNNVTEIQAENADFDPNFHHAVMTEAGEESGKVTKVLQKGYLMNSKVIRPAMVVVSE